MCGICGVVHFDPQRQPESARLRAMCATLAHRGPDGEGVEVLGQAGLGHRRLSVIDVEGGAQPMFNEDRSVAVVFNGEIYNFRELRRRLAENGHRMATDHSDTEAIVHLYEERGIDCLDDLRGMFALAIWDAKRRRLLLARDRVGKKPLYYAVADGALWFASEMKALLTVPGIPRRLNPAAVDDYLTHQYVPPPGTIFQDISKLPHAHRLVWEDGRIDVKQYWSLEYEPKKPLTPDEAKEQALEAVDEAVRIRLESDVPLGCFLSGGIDSSLVVAMMRRHISGPLRTFSIGFEEAGFNELPYARQVAQRYETEHEEFTVRAEAASALPRLAWHFDEPFADMAALPTFHLAELTRRHVTVALNGDGGDESFAGYERYRGLPVFRNWSRLPKWLRRLAVRPVAGALGSLFPRNVFLGNVEYVNETTLSDPAWRYVQMLLIFRDDMKSRMYSGDFAEQIGRRDALDLMTGHNHRPGLRTEIDRMLNCDRMTYLPEDLLPKVDRTTMAFGLEGRSPLLDHRLMEFAATLPGEVKFPAGRLKAVLKDAAETLLPAELIHRKKHGFSTPVGAWIGKGMKDLAHELILSDRAVGRGLFRRSYLEALMSQHAVGRQSHPHRLWALMCLEMWFRTFCDREDIAAGPLSGC
jgi:asparagine synthase (glutamine-hydrolysing)